MKLTSLVSFLPLAIASPLSLSPRQSPSKCGQYDSSAAGKYSVFANQWGAKTAGTTGSQCFSVTSANNAASLAWQTTWTWANNPNQVKSYTNVQTPGFPKKAVSAYTSMATTWSWSYTGTNIVANAAYDTFLGNSATSANLFEVMVWLGLYGSASPLSANGYPFTPIANVTISGVVFDLAYGLNGNVKVYSFVARSRAQTTFSGNLLDFFKYLSANYAGNGFGDGLVVQDVQAGTEVFTGTNGKLTTTSYTMNIT
ncbi:hypothetical protein B9Z65_8527 [Elsinoe australis]|uniref:Xyloglucan-specific endo-beta-1,4-glucanase A n=1 Tax=Elsinoe australis TaxID=40998 RepID=A0A2P7YDZ8_9PEZI|nr:hypothetical protein B9Z65_8527 [Elsinoe australis]